MIETSYAVDMSLHAPAIMRIVAQTFELVGGLQSEEVAAKDTFVRLNKILMKMQQQVDDVTFQRSFAGLGTSSQAALQTFTRNFC